MNLNAVQTLIKLQKETSTKTSEIAKSTGVRPTTIYSWLGGANPTVDKWVACIESMGYEVNIEKKTEKKEEKPKPMRNPFAGA